MRAKVKRFIAALTAVSLAVSMLVCLTACGGTVKVGIDVEPSEGEPITDSTLLKTENTVTELLTLYFKKRGERISEEKLGELVKKTVEVIKNAEPSDRTCSELVSVLVSRGEELVTTLADISRGEPEENAIDTLGGIYFDLTARVDSELLGCVAYGVLLVFLDRKIEKHLAAGDAVGEVLASKLMSRREVLTSDIGEAGFCELLRLGFFVRALFIDGTLRLDAADAFSDKELLIFIRSLDFTGLDIKPDGYKLVIDYYCSSLIVKDTSYLDELIYDANYNGDIDAVCELITHLPRLAAVIQGYTDMDNVGYLGEGDTEAFLYSVLGKFGDEDWALLELIENTKINSESYNAVAEKLYGDDFIAYKESTVTSSLEELRDAASSSDTESFYDTLEGYICSISPAFSYGLYSNRAERVEGGEQQ